MISRGREVDAFRAIPFEIEAPLLYTPDKYVKFTSMARPTLQRFTRVEYMYIFFLLLLEIFPANAERSKILFGTLKSSQMPDGLNKVD